MSEESKKIEKIEKEVKQDLKEVKPAELSEQELDKRYSGRWSEYLATTVSTTAIRVAGLSKVQGAD